MKKTVFRVGFLLALLLAGCGSSTATGPSKQAAIRTPTPITLRTNPSPQPTPTSAPLPVPVCPQLASAPEGAAPAAPLSLYLATPTAVLALNPADGSVRWQAPVAQGGTTLAALAVDSNIVYAATQVGEVVALDANNGEMRWCAAGAGPNPIIAASGGALYVGSSQSTTLLALNGADGKQLWKTSVAGTTQSLTVAGGQLYSSVLTTAGPGSFQALNPDTGAMLWQKQGGNGAFFSQPSVANGVVYVTEESLGNFASYLDAWDASSGAQRWQFQEPQGVELSQPVLEGSTVYALDTWGVYAIDASSGAQRWSVQMLSMANMDPLVMNGLLYFLTVNGAGQQIVDALDAGSGANRWSWNPTATALAAPDGSVFSPLSSGLPLGYTAGNGAVYVWYNGNVTALSASDGSQQWQAATNQSGPDVGPMVVG